jgi:hypothetical protein
MYVGEKPRHEDSLIGFDLFGGLEEEHGALLGHRDTVLAESEGDERTPLDGGRDREGHVIAGQAWLGHVHCLSSDPRFGLPIASLSRGKARSRGGGRGWSRKAAVPCDVTLRPPSGRTTAQTLRPVRLTNHERPSRGRADSSR